MFSFQGVRGFVQHDNSADLTYRVTRIYSDFCGLFQRSFMRKFT